MTRTRVSQAHRPRNASCTRSGSAWTARRIRARSPPAMRAPIRLLLLALFLTPTAHAAEGRNGMVAAEHRLASEAGLRILQRGGNAVDAAVATSLAVGVVNPSSCGIGGGGFMLMFDQATERVHALHYRDVAPAAATREMFVRDGKAVPELSLQGGLAVAVPGEISGLFAALRRFGTLPFSAVAAPAIAYARDGFPVEPHLADAIARQLDAIRHRPGPGARPLH